MQGGSLPVRGALAIALAAILSAGCSLFGFFDAPPADCDARRCADGDSDSDTDSDTDTDTDSDSDSDTDSDSDSDTDSDVDAGCPGDSDCDGSGDREDCEPENPAVHPGAEDPAGDGADSNCDGQDGDLDCMYVTDGTCPDWGCSTFCCQGTTDTLEVHCDVSGRGLCGGCSGTQFCCDGECREWRQVCSTNGFCDSLCGPGLECGEGQCRCDESVDPDCDGFFGAEDCDESDAGVHPGVPDSWEVTVVDSENGAGRHSSFALDADGNRHVSYLSPGQVRYATDGDWGFAPVAPIDDSVSPETETSLSVYGDAPCVAYSDSDGRVAVACRDGEAWEPLAGGAIEGRVAALAVDPGGVAHLAYCCDSDLGPLMHAAADMNDVAPAWEAEPIDDSEDAKGQIAIATNGGAVYVSYGAAGALTYASNANEGGVWTRNGTLGTVGTFTSIAVPEAGITHILYSREGDLLLRHSWYEWAWEDETLNDGDDVVADGGSMAMDAQGVLHAALHDTQAHTLGYASKSPGGAWSFETVRDPGWDTGIDPSIAVSETGAIGITFYDSELDALMLAWSDGIDQDCDGHDR